MFVSCKPVHAVMVAKDACACSRMTVRDIASRPQSVLIMRRKASGPSHLR